MAPVCLDRPELKEVGRPGRPIGSGSASGLEGRRHLLPDGSERFLVDESFLLALTRELGGVLADPLKTTNVQNLRCMTTWVVLKSG